MKIGVIGSGNIGTALTERLTAEGHDVRVANSRGPESLGDLASQTGATASTVEDAVSGADVVFLAVPQKAVPDLPKVFADALVVDTNNYYPGRDGQIAALEDGQAETAWVHEQLGARETVKVFNTIPAREIVDHATPSGDPDRRALPVAGEDGDGKQLVMSLVDQIGFDPVDAGPLSESWRQQPDTPVYVLRMDVGMVRDALERATKLR